MASRKRSAPARGTSLVDVAAAGGTSHTNVRRALVAAFPESYTGGRCAVPPDLGDLLATCFRGRTLARSTGQMLRSDPAAVLAGAEALAELARRALKQQQDRTEAAA